MKRLLILDSDYPAKDNLGDVFTHVRAKSYQKYYAVQVAGLNSALPSDYAYEEVKVRNFKTADELTDYILAWNPNILLIHCFMGWMLESLIYKISAPTIIWVHGPGSHGWYRRLFELNLTVISWKIFLVEVKIATCQMLKWNKLIKYSNLTGKVAFVCVSKWMKNILETDSFSHSRFIEVIPNPIDTEMFKYSRKKPEDRKYILILRSFGSKKYAGDLIVKTILELSKRPFFNELYFYLRGWGGMFDKLTEPLKYFKNIELHKGYIEQASIPDLHGKYGIMLCHTRQDTHGVSMCEAMSSGLVPIASDNSAIPEYVKEGVTGFLPKNCKEAADRVEYLYRNPDKFLEMSAAASESINRIAGINVIIPREIELIENMLSHGIAGRGAQEKDINY